MLGILLPFTSLNVIGRSRVADSCGVAACGFSSPEVNLHRHGDDDRIATLAEVSPSWMSALLLEVIFNI